VPYVVGCADTISFAADACGSCWSGGRIEVLRFIDEERGSEVMGYVVENVCRDRGQAGKQASRDRFEVVLFPTCCRSP
jgi:hypothetical protein